MTPTRAMPKWAADTDVPGVGVRKDNQAAKQAAGAEFPKLLSRAKASDQPCADAERLALDGFPRSEGKHERSKEPVVPFLATSQFANDLGTLAPAAAASCLVADAGAPSVEDAADATEPSDISTRSQVIGPLVAGEGQTRELEGLPAVHLSGLVTDEQAPRDSMPGRSTFAVERPAGGPPLVKVLQSETHLAPAVSAMAGRPADPLYMSGKPAVSGRPTNQGMRDAETASGEIEPISAPEPVTPGQSAMPVEGKVSHRTRLEVPPENGGAPSLHGARSSSSEHAAPVGAIDQALAKATSDSMRSAVQPCVAQIAARIVVEAAAAGDRAAAPLDFNQPAPSFAPTVKVLHIQLQPADLGTVTVRLTIRSDGLELQLEAGRRETLHRLHMDQDALSSALRSAGYAVDRVSIRAAATEAPMVSVPTDSGGLMQSNAGSAQPDARSLGGYSQSERNDNRSHTARRQDGEVEHASGTLGGDLYV